MKSRCFPLCACVLAAAWGLAHADVTCLDESGHFVDWFIVYKLPRLHATGLAYYYMDARAPWWVLSENTLDSPQQSVAFTLQQVYAPHEEILHVMYNDEHPDGGKSGSGHTKGVLASDESSGFWLVHSVPKFPPPANQSYSFPDTGEVYGQTMLCVSLPYKYMDVIGQLYLFNHPSFYDVSIPPAYAKANPHLVNATRKQHVTSQPFYHVTPLLSLKGQEFTAFAKYTLFHEDLYEDLVSESLMTSLYVETWQNGAGQDLHSNCSQQYKVYNVRGVQVLDRRFNETEDHSKWAVSMATSKPFACVGDINRQVPQLHRGGGTVCIKHAGVHNSFLKAVADYEKCV